MSLHKSTVPVLPMMTTTTAPYGKRIPLATLASIGFASLGWFNNRKREVYTNTLWDGEKDGISAVHRCKKMSLVTKAFITNQYLLIAHVKLATSHGFLLRG